MLINLENEFITLGRRWMKRQRPSVVIADAFPRQQLQELILSSVFTPFHHSFCHWWICCHATFPNMASEWTMKRENILLDKNQKGATTKDRMLRPPTTRLKVHLKISLSIVLYCAAPLHCVSCLQHGKIPKLFFRSFAADVIITRWAIIGFWHFSLFLNFTFTIFLLKTAWIEEAIKCQNLYVMWQSISEKAKLFKFSVKWTEKNLPQHQ